MAIGGHATGLLHQKAHRIGFIQQAKLAGFAWLAAVGRVHEDATADHDPMDVGNHRRDPAHVVVLAERAVAPGIQIGDILLDRLMPMSRVGGVDRIFLGVGRDHHAVGGQPPGAGFAIEGKAGHAVADRQHQQRRGAIDRIACGKLMRAGLQKRFFFWHMYTFGKAKHRENRADRDIDIDVGRTIERVEEQQKFALRIAVRNGVGMVHFLGGHRGQMAAPFVGFEQGLVGDHIELLLHFALNVLGSGLAQDAGQVTLAHAITDSLAGARHHLEQEPQLGWNQVFFALFFDQILREADLLVHLGFLGDAIRRVPCRRLQARRAIGRWSRPVRVRPASGAGALHRTCAIGRVPAQGGRRSAD